MNDNINEVWRDIPGYEKSHEVSNLGRVRTKDRVTEKGFSMKSKIVSPRICSSGYVAVTICATKFFLVHKLVAEVFLEKPRPDCTQVRFKDGNNRNVCADNLYWFISPLKIKKEQTQLKKLNKLLNATKKEKKEKVAKVKKEKVTKVKVVKVKEAKPKVIKPKVTKAKEKPKIEVFQLRLNGDFVRRYYSIDELLQVHPTWEKDVVMMNLTGDFPEAYGYRFVYEADYEKLNTQ